MATRKAIALIPQAQEILKDRKFTKSYQLAKKLNVSSRLAGQTLAAMKDWSIYGSKKRSRNVWIKGKME